MEQMTREQLESYRSMREEMKELDYKLHHPGEDDAILVNSVINDYRSGYPVPQAVVGVDLNKESRLYIQRIDRIARLKKECEVVEEYVEGIENSVTRRIFRMYFLEGMTQKEIAGIMHVDRSTVSRKLNAPIR